MFIARRTFEEVKAVFQRNARLRDVGGSFYHWLRSNYVAAILMYFRSQVDEQSGTVNLWQLMEAIAIRPDVLTLDRHREAHPHRSDSEWMRSELDRGYLRDWIEGGETADRHAPIDPAKVHQDQKALTEGLARIFLYASTTIAHKVRSSPVDNLSADEVGAAFTLIEETFKQYYLLLKGIALVSAEPAPMFNTHEVFTFPWIEQGGNSEDD